jgi:hypothetical protein
VVTLSEPVPSISTIIRVPANRPRGLDAVEHGVLGQIECRHAVVEQRAEAGGFVQTPRVELGEVDDQGDRRLALVARQAGQRGGQFIIRE